MAFNWDKLCKAQRDYPKPKLALPYVDKLIKKNPGNPYLIAWKADISLQLHASGSNVVDSLVSICQHKSVHTDLTLLEYTYSLLLKATRKSDPKNLSISSVGNEGVKAWQNAAANCKTKRDRKELWDSFFDAAIREDCWEDVRIAVVKYRAEASASDKTTYYTQILAQQLSGEQKIEAATLRGAPDMSAQIQLSVALKQMKTAYERPPDDPVSVKDIRDLRFMAKIYARQDRLPELFQMWKSPPAHLTAIMEKHQVDVSILKVELLTQAKQWSLLEEHTLELIEEALALSTSNGDSEPLRQLCASRWDVWKGLIEAMSSSHPKEETKEKLSLLLDRVFGSEGLKLDRSLRLVRLALRRFLGHQLLADCKEYWQHHSQLASCFTDIRQSVELLSTEDRAEFLQFIEDQTRGLAPTSSDSEGKPQGWVSAEVNVLTFTYLLTFSLLESPTSEALESLIAKASKLAHMSPENQDAGFLVVYSLLNHDHKVMSEQSEEPKKPDETVRNSRLLLQATMLARALVERDVEKQNRKLSLISARLHLNLGLGKTAFRQWRHVKCKEMLVDTLSPYLLSRISQTHPFDVKDHQGFSADKELRYAIDTIERMEDKQEELLFSSVKRFLWDSAIDQLRFKGKLHSSLTKQVCAVERRRIARLKGESTGDLPEIDYSNYRKISDNVDRTVLPNFEHSKSIQPTPVLVQAGIPTKHWLFEQDKERESINRILYRELAVGDVKDVSDKDTSDKNLASAGSDQRLAERYVNDHFWSQIGDIVRHINDPAAPAVDASLLDTLKASLQQMRVDQEKLVLPDDTGFKLEDEPTMFHENMLMSCYTKLEVLRALPRLIEHIREKVVNVKIPHPMKRHLSKDYLKDMSAEAQQCYDSIRNVAQSHIALIKRRGAAAIKAQVRWGSTGEVLKSLLSDDDVDTYAKEYVDSALEAWNGVLKVKLK